MATLITAYGSEEVSIQLVERNNRTFFKIQVLSRPYCIELFEIDYIKESVQANNHLLTLYAGEKKYTLSFTEKADAAAWKSMLEPLSKKKQFIPPEPLYKKKITEFYVCGEDGLLTIFKTCDTKARYCPSNCSCDSVCEDKYCKTDCVPDCSYDCKSDCGDSYYSKVGCGDRGCYMDNPGCWGHCLNDWD